MSKSRDEAYYEFLTGFGWEVYDQYTVPDNAPLPRITYDMYYAEFEGAVTLSISLWDRSTSWVSVTEKADEIYKAIGLGGKIIPYDDELIWVKRGSPFAQRMGDEDDTIRRIYIILDVEDLTAF